MPFLADYMCQKCHRVSEILSTTGEILACPLCGHTDLTKVPSGHATKCHDPEVLKTTLKERSAKHTLQELKKQSGWKTGILPPHLRKGAK